MGKVALFGGGGAIGGSVAEALGALGREYRVVGRSRGPLEKQYGRDPLAEVATWDPDDPASVRAAARGVDTLVYLVGVPYWEFHLHPELMKRTVDAAVAENVERVVLVGTVYPYGRPRANPVREDHPREPHTYKGKMRKAQEDVLLEADAAGKIRGTVLRLPDFYGPGVERSFLHDAFRAAVDNRRAKMVGPIDAAHEYVYVPDVGPVVVALADEPRAYGRWWHFAGAGVTTQRKLSDTAFAAAGNEPKRLVANKLMVRAAGLFDPFMRELVEMHYLLTDPVLMDDSALAGLLGGLKKTPYDEGVRRCVEAERSKGA